MILIWNSINWLDEHNAIKSKLENQNKKKTKPKSNLFPFGYESQMKLNTPELKRWKKEKENELNACLKYFGWWLRCVVVALADGA